MTTSLSPNDHTPRGRPGLILPLAPAPANTDVKPIYGFGGGRRRASITAAANVDGAGSVHTLASVAKTSPAPGGLSQLFAHSEVSSRATSRAPSDDERAQKPTASAGGKKKKNKKGKNAAKKNQIRDLSKFDADFETPKKGSMKSAEDAWSKLGGLAEPDWTFMKRPVTATSSTCSSRSSSPPRPSGLSSLLSQADPGNLVSVVYSSDTSVCSEAGDIPSPGETYEVALDEDYVAPSAAAVPRKMHADDFQQLRCLGKGTYGTVVLVRHRETGKLYAQKQLKKASLIVHKKMVEQTQTERAILESVNHPFVVKLYYAFQDHEKLYLILEYAQGGELFLHLSQQTMLPEATAVFYLAQLVLALSHLHLNVGVVYRDLKPENCLLDHTGNLLLTDFGLSKVKTDDSACRSFLGTPEYMAPEVLQGNGEKEYGCEVDWWGVGALACDLMTGFPPFRGNSHKKVAERIQKQKLSLPYFLSAEAKDLITRLLRKDPTKRLGYNMPKDLATIKAHRFFRKIDWEALERREVEPPIVPFITEPELAENFSAEFTGLSLSPPVVGEGVGAGLMGVRCEGRGVGQERGEGVGEDPFGGFSFVASRSVLDAYGRE
ncbi:kinase-like domain-containing protein [Morchella snyderi]|nr:kinase-like domain-containing protein [Morchella snyderi]